VRFIPVDLAACLGALDEPPPELGPLRLAAVVALLLADPEGVRVVLIERSSGLRTHAGQLALPGGKVEAGDLSLWDTALREAQEEVGLDPSLASPLGRLPAVPTPTGFLVVPFVAHVDRTWRPRVASDEVGGVLVPRLADLADPAIHRVTGTREYRGRRYDLHRFDFHDPPLWGVTALIIWELLQRMSGHDPRDPSA